MRYALVAPILDYQEKGLIVSHLDFALLVLSCVFIAAGGYIINDIEDVKIDSINKESRVLINAKINADSANNLYMVLSFLGVAIGFYLTFVKEIKLIGMINLITAGLLYFYSTSYKCIPVLGNIISSALSGLMHRDDCPINKKIIMIKDKYRNLLKAKKVVQFSEEEEN
jgi:4-hydroxybenzoate polyprenyltransferase